jgi:hypothetical protein
MAGVTDRDGLAPAPPACIRVETVVSPDGTALLRMAGELAGLASMLDLTP